MLRATSSRRIAQYKFGQPALNRAFGPLPREKKTAVDAGAQVTTLANGVKIVTHDRDGAHSAIGIYADAGPKYDPAAAPGLSYVMRFALLTANYDNSLFQIDRAMRSTGFAYGHAEVRKRYTALKVEGRRDLWESPFTHMATCIAAPRFHEPDLERFRDTMDNQLSEHRWQNPREYVLDQLETVAFFKEPLGNPRMVPATVNDKCTSELMLEQYSALYVPSNITVAAVNVKHQDLVAAYHAAPLPHSADAPHHAKAARVALAHTNEAAQFYPGRHATEYENRAKEMGTKPDMEDEVIAAFGVPTYGRDESIQQYAAAVVLQEFVSVALQEGIRYSRDDFNGVRVFYRPYSSAGLVGVTARGAPSAVPQMLRDGAAAFAKKADEATVAAAKARAAMRIHSEQLEVVRDYVDFLGTSKQTADEVLEAVSKVTVKDVSEALDKARSVKPAVFATGKTHDFPSTQNLNLRL